jgi:hypothetical protein
VGRLRAGFGLKTLKNALKRWNSHVEFLQSGRRKCHDAQLLQLSPLDGSTEWGSGALSCLHGRPLAAIKGARRPCAAWVS